ncbi:MAG TPA: NAD(P)-dependent oxidoreductase [Planctomycetota bacterium]|nr:NAD(P)-dependent oxidoreductase [Planctomycetota bacterium]
MKVFITGVNGFIAGRLAEHLGASGHRVSGSSRTPSSLPGARVWSLGDPTDESMFRKVDVLIHCAHDFSRGAIHRNVDGTLALANAARRAGVARQIFVSSLSARPEAISEYGRAKFQIERAFLERGDTVVRPGTVIGKGGLFGKMASMIRERSILPLVDGGKAELTVIGISDLCRAMEAILGRSEPREYNLFYPDRPLMRDLLLRLRERLGRKTLFVPVPGWALLVPLTILRWLRIPSPVDIENLKGYLRSRDLVHPSNLSAVLERPTGIDPALSEV